MSPKQRTMLERFHKAESFTLDEAAEVIGQNIYYRAVKRYVGLTLSRMVKNGLLVRVKPGVFRVANTPIAQREKREDEMI